MTEISYSQRGDMKRITLNGHALFNPGNDIVCASVSAITYQLLNTIVDMVNNDEASDYIVDANEKEGRMIISLLTKDAYKWDIVWQVVSRGYANLAQAYPDNVRIISRCT